MPRSFSFLAAALLATCAAARMLAQDSQAVSEGNETVPVGNDTLPKANDTLPKANDTLPKANDTEIRARVKGSINHGGGKQEWRTVTGPARVLGPATLAFADGTRITLAITAPAGEQMAMNGGELYPCGQHATEFLRDLIGDRPVTCFQDADGEGPWLGYVGDVNIEHAMIVAGWALADHSSLHAAEIIARANQRGLWRGEFVRFDDWKAGVRLPGEAAPAPIADEREAAALLAAHADASEAACATLVARLLRDVPRLRSLEFPLGARLSDESLTLIARLPDLQMLNLEYCASITDAGLAHLRGLRHLGTLKLPPGTTDQGLEHVATLSELRHLEISYAPISDRGMRHLAALRKLRHLVLYRVEITDDGLAPLQAARELRRLTLYDVPMSDEGLKHFIDLPNLSVLAFGRIPLSDNGASSLAKLAALEYLDLSDTGITERGARQLVELKHLRILLLPQRLGQPIRGELRGALPDLRFEGRPEDVATPDILP